MVKVTGNDVPGAIGQGRAALLPGFEMPRVNGTGQVRQGFGSGAERELGGTAGGCLSAVAGSLEHWTDPLWDSML